MSVERLIKAPMSLIDTVLDIVQLSVMMSVFVVVFPIIISLASYATGMSKSLKAVTSS
jgi:hypothetical protein